MIKMYRNFTITLLGLLFLTAVTDTVFAQCDPRFSGANFYGTSSPNGIATVLKGETGQLKFNFGVGPQPTCTSAAGNSPGGITVSIVFPVEYAPTSAADISGPQASLYNWTYNAATRTLTGVNNATIPTGGAPLFTVNVVGNVVTPGADIPLTHLSWTSAATPPITNSATANDIASAGLNVDAKPPVTTPDAITTPAGTPVTASVLTNDTPGSAAIDPSSVKLLDPATNTPVSSVTVPGQGTYTVNPGGTVTFTPVAGFTGPATPVSYTVSDVDGVVSNSSTISVTVTAVPPTAVPDLVTTPSGTPVTVTVTTNDTPGSSPIDPTTVKLIDPNTGTPVTTVTVPGEGTYTVNPGGTITFTPVTGFDGPGTPVSYTVKDGDGNTSNPAPITVTVTAIPPTAVPDIVTTPAGTPVTVTVTTNDTPGSSPIDPTTVKLIDPNTGTPVTTVTIPGEGTYTVNPGGTITFTPVTGFDGPGTPVSYTVKDGDGNTSNPAPITVTVTAVPPTAVPDIVTTPGGTPVTVTVTTNDTPGSSPIDPTTVKLIDPNTGTPVTTVTIPGEGTYTVNPGGTITFTPDPGFDGPGTPVSYTVEDTDGNTSNPAPITVTVTATPPVAVPDVVTTPSGTPVTITTTTNDTPGTSPIDPTTVKLIDPNTGTPVTTVTVPGEGTYTVNPDGTITFTPLTGFNGPSSTISYTVTDVDGHTSNPATITVNVTAVPPVAVPDVATTTVGTPVVLTVTTNDIPGSSAIDPQIVKLIDPVTGLQVLVVTVPNEGTYSVNASTGQLTFTPVAGFVGTATPISYVVQDNAGSFSNPATITVTVTAVPPTANGDSGNSPNGTPVAVTVLNNDTPGSFPLDPTTVKLIDPNTGTPSTSVTIPGEGTYTVDPGTGVVTFTPDPTVTTPITSTITYTVTDTDGNTSTPATITINATPLPVTLTVFKATKEGQSVRLDWATTAETNSDYFEVQHSTTGKDWHLIGKVASHGESTAENKYNFTDSSPVLGSENLYRLKMVDKDATFAYSRIQSVKFDGSNTAAVSIYPNPSSDKVFVQDMDLSQVKQVAIIDMNGRTVLSSNAVTSNGINVSKLIAGTYVLHITNLNGSVSNHKIVIVR